VRVNFFGMGSVYLMTNGPSTVDDPSGTVIVDPAGGPPRGPAGFSGRIVESELPERRGPRTGPISSGDKRTRAAVGLRRHGRRRAGAGGSSVSSLVGSAGLNH